MSDASRSIQAESSPGAVVTPSKTDSAARIPVSAPAAPALAGLGARRFSDRVKKYLERILEPIGRKLNFRFYSLGFMPYYWAIPERGQLKDELWKKPSELVGVKLDEPGQLQLLEELRSVYANEYNAIDTAFGPVDSQLLHAMVRHHRPRRVIEIGAGDSTKIIASALLANAAESGVTADFTTIEPYPNPSIRAGVAGLTRLIEKRVQDVSLNVFSELQSGDLLFIDSSHVLAIGSDVQYEILEILPRLQKGVIIHIHDILMPNEYHREWVMGGRFWSEQYLLQAFLAFNDSFEILLAAQNLHLRYPEALRAAFSCYDPSTSSPGSFWIRRTR